jgi:hypothetical protein
MVAHPMELTMAQIIGFSLGGAAKNGINISLKNANRAFIYCFVGKGADATQTTFTLAQSSGNAGSATGTGEKALSDNVPIYTSDGFQAAATLTSQTAAKAYQCAVTQSVTQLVVFDIVPQNCMDVASGFDCIVVNATDPAAANCIGAFAIIEPRYSPLPSPYSD